MSKAKVNVYRNNGALLGYFSDPQINQFAEEQYEIKGMFFFLDGSLPSKLDFNPQSLPYWATLENIPKVAHQQLTNIYIQRGRQPVAITGLGNKV